MAKDSTEQKIKETAIRIFLKEGKLLATTQDIADVAGVNRALLHYYFRSRDLLFNTVFTEILTDMRHRLHEAMNIKTEFRKKIETILDIICEYLMNYPYLETAISMELNAHPDKYEDFFVHIPGGKERLKNFLKEIENEMNNESVPKMKPVNYLMNIFALMTYPYIARPLFKNMFDLSDTAFNKLLLERRQIALSFLFK